MHDIGDQHLLMLKSVKYEPSRAFITALMEMKLDQNTMSDLQMRTHSKTNVPHFEDFLDLVDLQVRA